MTLTEVFLAQLADPFRIGLLIALIATTMRTVTVTGKVIPLLAVAVFVAVLIPATLSPPQGVTMQVAAGVGLAANAVILAALLAGYALLRRIRRG
ncbi:MAG: hypothetical protein IOC91_01545 [Rhodobacter sp.]|nr:hypothetical protein [Rhodobacter sp.]